MDLNGYLTGYVTSGHETRLCTWHNHWCMHDWILVNAEHTKKSEDSGHVAIGRDLLDELKRIKARLQQDAETPARRQVYDFFGLYPIVCNVDPNSLILDIAKLDSLDLTPYQDLVYYWY